jgi:RNA polymerase sigma factor (sigma-70 family)
LYRRHVADVYRYALVMLDSPADAEDVTQTTFLNAYRALARGEQPRAAGSWLRTIAHNLCLQHFRQAARRPAQVELDNDAAKPVNDESAVNVDDLVRALRQIPVNQRAALVMRELEGRPIAEIANVLGLSVSAVETQLFRARRSVREQLEGSLTCAQAERAISRQLDGSLPRAERGALRAHIRQCDECAHLARSLRAQRGAIKSLSVLPIPAGLAWSNFGTGAAISGIAGTTAGASAAGGALLTGSLAAKLAGATIVAALAAGVGYEATANHPHRAAHPAPTAGRAAPAIVRPVDVISRTRHTTSPASGLLTSTVRPHHRHAPEAVRAANAGGRVGRQHAAITHGAASARSARNPSAAVGRRRNSHAGQSKPKPTHPTKPSHPTKPTHPTHPTHSSKPTHPHI